MVATAERPALNAQAHADILAALSATNLPDVHWLHGDDLCDCTFQRIGEWTNPYLGKTLRVRMCCVWAELEKLFPRYFQRVDAYYDSNRHAWVQEPRAWDSAEADMPLPLWYRHLAAKTGKPLPAVRAEYRGRQDERPKRTSAREDAPTEAEVQAAKNARLRLAGWL